MIKERVARAIPAMVILTMFVVLCTGCTDSSSYEKPYETGSSSSFSDSYDKENVIPFLQNDQGTATEPAESPSYLPEDHPLAPFDPVGADYSGICPITIARYDARNPELVHMMGDPNFIAQIPAGSEIPFLIDPGIYSRATCRGACGEDCPTDRCSPADDITIPFTYQGVSGLCVYRQVIACPSHQGCRDHDACYDYCTEQVKETDILGACHAVCNQRCYAEYGIDMCVRWADLPKIILSEQMGNTAGQTVDWARPPLYDASILYSASPTFEISLPTTAIPSYTPAGPNVPRGVYDDYTAGPTINLGKLAE
jgi:hypothetical protein